MVDTKYVMRYNERLLAQFWKKAKAISHRGKNILLVFDNCIGLVIWKAPIVDEVFSNHRHNNVSILVATQYPNKLPTLIQEVSWVACIFKQGTSWSCRAIQSSYGEDLSQAGRPMTPLSRKGPTQFCWSQTRPSL